MRSRRGKAKSNTSDQKPVDRHCYSRIRLRGDEESTICDRGFGTNLPPPCQTGKSHPNTMPPMSLKGVVTKVGAMSKTATVTVSRWVIHKQTGKVRTTSCPASLAFLTKAILSQRIERSKKYLTHDENDGVSFLRNDDQVLIRNCPPISARKRFTLDQVLRSPETQHELMHKNAAANSPGP